MMRSWSGVRRRSRFPESAFRLHPHAPIGGPDFRRQAGGKTWRQPQALYQTLDIRSIPQPVFGGKIGSQLVIYQTDHGVSSHREGQLPSTMRTRFLHPSDPGDLIVGRSFRPDFDGDAVWSNHREARLRLAWQTERNTRLVWGDSAQRPDRPQPIRS